MWLVTVNEGAGERDGNMNAAFRLKCHLKKEERREGRRKRK